MSWFIWSNWSLTCLRLRHSHKPKSSGSSSSSFSTIIAFQSFSSKDRFNLSLTSSNFDVIFNSPSSLSLISAFFNRNSSLMSTESLLKEIRDSDDSLLESEDPTDFWYLSDKFEWFSVGLTYIYRSSLLIRIASKMILSSIFYNPSYIIIKFKIIKLKNWRHSFMGIKYRIF